MVGDVCHGSIILGQQQFSHEWSTDAYPKSDPSLEGHASRNLTDGLWLSADAYYNVGGETTIDGTNQDNMANTLRVGDTSPKAEPHSSA